MRTIWNYIDVLKPRETILLTYIGILAGVVAAEGSPASWTLLVVFMAVLLGSGGCNGLTNYLDRKVDIKMARTCGRALPSKRIWPPEKMLPLAIGLVATALVLAYMLHPLCFAFGFAGSFASVIYRKRAMCVFQGMVAGCAPVLIGYLAFSPHLNWTILLMCLLIVTWIPLHVWSVMVARREEYFEANIAYFPLTIKTKNAIKILFGLSILLYIVSILLWHAADFDWLYFAIANLTGLCMIWAGIGLLKNMDSVHSWRMYKLSSFPYLGIIFLAMCLNFWV